MTRTEWKKELRAIRGRVPRCPYEPDTARVCACVTEVIDLLLRVGEQAAKQGNV